MPGVARGVTAAEADEADDVPALFVAVAVKVYDVPLVRDETTHDVAGDVTVQVAPPGVAVTKYDVGALPDDGATMVTVAWPLPATAVGVPGAPGVVMTVNVAEDDVVDPTPSVTMTR